MAWKRWLCVAVSGCLGCGTSTLRATSSPDTPVPAGEPRAAVTLALDLHQAQDCEEAFDLSMYQSRAVDVIEWDSNAGRCVQRTVRIVYLPQRMTKDGVIAEARKRSAKLSVTADR